LEIRIIRESSRITNSPSGDVLFCGRRLVGSGYGFRGLSFVYRFEEPIVPMKPVRTGNLYRAQRVWAAIDLLLTCDTIREARDKTQARLAEVGAG
jgi:hypothetical protein